jgi:hypothetical protein
VSELLGVELARPGTWQLASGPLTVTAEMLTAAARYAQRKGARPAAVKIGHTDPRFNGDGEPAMGWLENYRVEDDDGPVLKADVKDMPEWLKAAAPKAWPYRSIEGWQDIKDDDGETYSLVIDGLALLGVTPPGMSTIRSLRDLPQALGVAASARIVASMGDAKTPALKAEAVPQEEGAGMNLAKYREALAGLPDDASAEDVAKVNATFGVAAAPPEPASPAPNPPPPAPQPHPQPGEHPEPQKVNASAIPGTVPGTVVISETIWNENQETIKTLKAFVDKTKRDERDKVIAQAVQEGRLRPADKKVFAAQWDVNPEGTRQIIETLHANAAFAVEASGYAAEATDDDFEREYAGLFPPSGKGR